MPCRKSKELSEISRSSTSPLTPRWPFTSKFPSILILSGNLRSSSTVMYSLIPRPDKETVLIGCPLRISRRFVLREEIGLSESMTA
jgi:hypothetical protein